MEAARKHPLSDDLDYRGETFISGATVPEELSIHSARHTIAVQLLKKTGNLRQVQKQLGHASPVTTANMYADITFEDMQNGLNGLYQQKSRTAKVRLAKYPRKEKPSEN